MAGENIDLTSGSASERSGDGGSDRRRFVGIHFACCDVYARIYVNRAESAYTGYCPRCMRPLELRIVPGGSSDRFFTAY